VEWIKPGMTEQEVALELEVTMRKLGATTLSFETIAASGENSSMPHAVPTGRRLKAGDFLTMDFGCVYEGYCSDMTRTVFIKDCGLKQPTAKQLEIYNTVLTAQLEAMKMIKPGVVCSDVDACARRIISDAGYGDYFGHGLGHSVGLFIHEEPRFSKKCDTVLEPGMVITVEPGIYLPGEFGVRIEDLVVVTEDGYENLTHSRKELVEI
jgi:Xaa-Pro aminopeptidase